MNNQKTARVILMTSYGADIFPSEIEDNVRAVMKSDGPLWRLNSNLISKIDSLKYLDLDINDIKSISNVDRLIRVSYNDDINRKLYLYPVSNGYVKQSSFSIVDVDITRPWMICSYDGSEYIKYLDETKLISEEYNLYQEILN